MVHAAPRQRIQYILSSSLDEMKGLPSADSSTSKGFANKKVRFRLSESSYIDAPPNPDPPIDKSDLFYTKEELHRIELERHDVIECIHIHCLHRVDELESQHRGLEAHMRMPDHYRQQYLHKSAVEAVLSEQLRQHEKGIYEPEALAASYTIFSRWTKLKARLLAQKDAQIATRIISTETPITINDEHNIELETAQEKISS